MIYDLMGGLREKHKCIYISIIFQPEEQSPEMQAPNQTPPPPLWDSKEW